MNRRLREVAWELRGSWDTQVLWASLRGSRWSEAMLELGLESSQGTLQFGKFQKGICRKYSFGIEARAMWHGIMPLGRRSIHKDYLGVFNILQRHSELATCCVVPRYKMNRFNNLQVHVLALPAYNAAEVAIHL